jgi:tetratricopeptide (TPR) repeat protein
VNAASLLAQAGSLEQSDPAAALSAYERAAAADPALAAAWANRGRLLHERGSLEEACQVYRDGLTHCARTVDAPLLLFNLGCVLEDLGQMDAALASYQEALARLYESLGRTQHAIRHLSTYRRLARSEP